MVNISKNKYFGICIKNVCILKKLNYLVQEKKQEILEDYMKGVAIINKLLEEDYKFIAVGESADLRHLAQEIFTKIDKYIKDGT